ncbi:MAG TPA: selenoneine biosynthesis selenosugar synthase SenB [Ramlibacter sp.]|nr:selenoneine biosynthesis selenosugar synthase SenB [Ramlibacter sp.]
MPRSSVVIVSPALAGANNGNWQTARRWSGFLHGEHPVRIVAHWPDSDAQHDSLMIALHARRSAESIAQWAKERSPASVALVLTGTDLYRDIGIDPAARRSLELAGRLVVLQELGLEALPPAHRAKARVIFQSMSSRQPLPKAHGKLRAVMVGHMREVKSPETYFDAARLLRQRSDIELHHIGRAEDEVWAERAQRTAAECPSYRWHGGLPHEDTRRAIQRAHVLVHTSAMEGGAHVIMEAVCSGTPVIASRVSGNIGMLGWDYEGYFPHGDAKALAHLLKVCRATQGTEDPGASLLARLRAQCLLRAPLFAPENERKAVLQLARQLEESA